MAPENNNQLQVNQSLSNLLKDAVITAGTAEGYIHVQMTRLDNDMVHLRTMLANTRAALIQTESLLNESQRARDILERTLEALVKEPHS